MLKKGQNRAARLLSYTIQITVNELNPFLVSRVTWSRRCGGGHSRCTLIGVTFDTQTVTTVTSKKSCPAGFFDENSSNNLTIQVGTHPGGWEDHRRSYKFEKFRVINIYKKLNLLPGDGQES